MIERVRTKDSVIYKCVGCNKVLGELTDVGEVIVKPSCEHYKWIESSIECFYYMLPGCGRSVMRWLKENYVLKLESPGTVFLLIPRQS